MAKWFECSEISVIRRAVEGKLDLPPYAGPKDETESAAAYWFRLERAGLLLEALALYDRLAAEREEWRRTRRETTKEFEARVEHEGRSEQAQRLRAELLRSGLGQREVHEEVVKRLQPLNGSATRAWPTPDPWEGGRLFRKKSVQEIYLEMTTEECDSFGSSQFTLAAGQVPPLRSSGSFVGSLSSFKAGRIYHSQDSSAEWFRQRRPRVKDALQIGVKVNNIR